MSGGYAIPPEQLPSEESNFMQHNDYGYGEKVAPAEPILDETRETLNSHGEKLQSSFEAFSYAARALSDAQTEYDRAERALTELQDRFQKAFFVMNENIKELNAWLNSRQKSQSEG